MSPAGTFYELKDLRKENWKINGVIYTLFFSPSHTHITYTFEQQPIRMSFNYKISPQLVVFLKHRETEQKKITLQHIRNIKSNLKVNKSF